MVGMFVWDGRDIHGINTSRSVDIWDVSENGVCRYIPLHFTISSVGTVGT